ncbi:MAG: hypothetical protein ACJAUP_003188 [Cellvibrionaceae bacterium]|jgi:hypothetical protein
MINSNVSKFDKMARFVIGAMLTFYALVSCVSMASTLGAVLLIICIVLILTVVTFFPSL